MTTVAWIGSALLAACALPQTIECIRSGNANGLSWWFLGMWFVGEILLLAYAVDLASAPLVVNYLANALMISTMLSYKVRPRR